MHAPPARSTTEPDNPTHKRVQSSASTGSLSGASFEKWFPIVKTQVNLAPFVSALSRLEQSKLRGEIFESHGDVREGIPQLSEDGERLTLERFAQLAPPAQKRVVQELFARRQKAALRIPITNYVDCVTDDAFTDESAIDKYSQAGTSLIREGVLPAAKVHESLKLAELTLLANASSPTEYEKKLLLGTSLVALSYFAPPQVTGVIASLVGIVSILNHRDTRIGREAIRGYILESFDAYETIRTGNVRDLGQTLNELFGDPMHRERYQKLWQASGFTVARMLRIFGRSPEEIFSLFLDSPCLNLRYNPTVQRTREHLEDHEAVCPQNILAPFTEDSEEGEPLADTETLINQLNEVYFTRAICERERLRCDLAQKIFESPANS